MVEGGCLRGFIVGADALTSVKGNEKTSKSSPADEGAEGLEGLDTASNAPKISSRSLLAGREVGTDSVERDSLKISKDVEPFIAGGRG